MMRIGGVTVGFTIGGLALGMAILLTGIIVGRLRKSRPVPTGKVRFHIDVALCGVALGVICLGCAVDAFFFADSPDVAIIFFAFAIVTSMFIVAYVNCQITYDEDGFVVKNFFGKKRTYTYAQITSMEEDVGTTWLYIGKQNIWVGNLYIGNREFLTQVKSKYQAAHNEQPLPEKPKSKYDPFNGNIRNVVEILFGYGLMSVVAAAMLIFALVECYTPSTVNNTIKHTVQLSYCEVRDDRILLVSSDDRVYTIGEIDEQIDAKPFQILSACQETVTIYFTEGRVAQKGQTPPYFVKAVTHEGETVLSFEETDRLHRQVAIWLVVAAGGLCLLLAIYITCAIIVGRNPKKFSKRIVKLFFKEKYVK